MTLFESSTEFNMGDSSFLEKIHELIQEEAQSLYDDLFSDTSLEGIAIRVMEKMQPIEYSSILSGENTLQT